jgi:hypothetical protein
LIGAWKGFQQQWVPLPAKFAEQHAWLALAANESDFHAGAGINLRLRGPLR